MGPEESIRKVIVSHHLSSLLCRGSDWDLSEPQSTVPALSSREVGFDLRLLVPVTTSSSGPSLQEQDPVHRQEANRLKDEEEGRWS